MEWGGGLMVEIDLKEFLLVLKNKLWMIGVVILLCASVSGLLSYYVLPLEYETYTTLMIGKPRDYTQKIEYDDVLLNQKLIYTYGEIAKSKVVANEFMSNLDLNFTYEELNKKIQVSLVDNTEIIKILVKDENGKVAAAMANELANVFMKHVAGMMHIDNIQVIDRAEVPAKPSGPIPILYMAVSSGMGMLFSILGIFIYQCFDNKVRTPEDIEKALHLPIIGMIPKLV